jgi:hypothetical protein
LKRSAVAVLCAVTLTGLAAYSHAQNYEVVAVSDGGTIEGIVKLAGSAPEIPAIKTTKNQDYCGNSIPNPLYTIGKDSGLANVEVYLKGITKGKAKPTGAITLSNDHCMFRPRIQGASTGQQITINSLDPILHNTHPMVDATSQTLYNIALPFKGFSVTKPLPNTPELIRVKCDAHEWMRAWVWEFEHPYYATTDADGHFKITDVPPGTYTVVAWHEVMGPQEKSVSVPAGKPVTAEFSFTPKK